MARRVLRRIGPDPEELDGRVYWNATVVEFDGRRHVVSHNAILTLVTVNGCNAACRFCSNEVTFMATGPFLAWDRRLARVKELALLAGVTKIAYTGGEPTVSPARLLDLVARTAPGFRKARLHTNGFGLLHPVETPEGPRPLMTALAAHGLTGISISIAHHDEAVNRAVMRFKSPRFQGLDDDTLRRIAAEDAGRPLARRLSCVMTRESVADTRGILDYVAWGRRLGFRRFIFRSPSGIPGEFTKRTEFSTYNHSRHIDIDPVTRDLERLPGWVERYRQHKTDSHVHVYQVDGEVTVDVDESSEEEDPDEKIRRLNVMPNGVTYTSWIDPCSHLFDDEREDALANAARELPVLAARRGLARAAG